MKNIRINGFRYEGAFGEMQFDGVTISLPDQVNVSATMDLENVDFGLSASEILRMERDLALHFFKNQYRSVLLGERTITPTELKGIQDILGVNRAEFGKLLGLHKASVTNLFKGKAMSSTLANLIMERLGMELCRPGSARLLLVGGAIPPPEAHASTVVNEARYSSNEVA